MHRAASRTCPAASASQRCAAAALLAAAVAAARAAAASSWAASPWRRSSADCSAKPAGVASLSCTCAVVSAAVSTVFSLDSVPTAALQAEDGIWEGEAWLVQAWA